jgi:hypothetical protein
VDKLIPRIRMRFLDRRKLPEKMLGRSGLIVKEWR